MTDKSCANTSSTAQPIIRYSLIQWMVLSKSWASSETLYNIIWSPFFLPESLFFLSKIEAAPPYEHADKDVGDRVV